jgi:hypothetical protein
MAEMSIRPIAIRSTDGGTEMQYMLLIYDDPQVWSKLSEAERDQMMAEYRSLTAQIKATGQYVAGAQLRPVDVATSVRVRAGERLVTDGPFAETREHLGGYYLIEVRDLDEALGIAARIPSARVGTVEVRPVVATPRSEHAPGTPRA